MIPYLFLFNCITLFTFAMEEDGRFLILSIDAKPHYIKKGPDLKKLETQYGKTFPPNTIFFPIVFHNMREEFLPECIAYDDIKETKEGESIIMHINGKEELIRINQQNPYHWCGLGIPFEQLRDSCIKHFKGKGSSKKRYVNNEEYISPLFRKRSKKNN